MNKNSNDFKTIILAQGMQAEEIGKLKKELNALKQELDTLKQNFPQEIKKELRKILGDYDSINQNSVEFWGNLTQGGQNYANTQSGILTGFREGASPATQLQPNDFNTQQDTLGNGRDDERHTSNIADMPTSTSESKTNGQGISGDREGDMPESRSGRRIETSKTRIETYEAVGAGLKEFTRIYRKQIKLNEYELKRCEGFFQQYSRYYDYAEPKIKSHLEQLFNKNLKTSINTFHKQFTNTYDYKKQSVSPEFALKIKGYVYVFEKMNLTMHKQNQTEVDKLLKNEHFMSNAKNYCTMA